MINERLKAVRQALNLSQAAFAESIGLKQGSYSDIESGRTKGITKQSLMLMEIIHHVSIDYLYEKSEDMFREPDECIGNGKSIIKYFPSVYGSMGGIEFLDNPSEQCVNLILPNFPNSKFAINAYGDSMSPVIKSGQIVILSEWKENFIDFGKIYLVITKTGYRTIKYINQGKDSEHILCKSENKENDPFEVAMNDIYNLYLVDGWICKESI